MIEIVGASGVAWQYDLDAPLGRGGFGVVYRGTGPEGRQVAVKIVRDLFERDIGSKSVEREVQMHDVLRASDREQTLRHLLIPLDYVLMHPDLGLILPLAETSLAAALNEKLLSPSQKLDVARNVIAGLEELAQLSVLHRDIKPENVMFASGVWKLGDFGVSKLREDSTTDRSLWGAGTPQYLAPELWRGEVATVRSDLYALGVTLYFLFANQLPFTGPDFAHQHTYLVPTAPANAPESAQRLIARLLEKDPAKRPQDARSALDFLESQESWTQRPAIFAAAAAAEERLRLRQNEADLDAHAAREYLTSQTQGLAEMHEVLRQTVTGLHHVMPEASLVEGDETTWTICTQLVDIRFQVLTKLGEQTNGYALACEIWYEWSTGDVKRITTFPVANAVYYAAKGKSAKWIILSFMRRSALDSYADWGTTSIPHGVPVSELPKASELWRSNSSYSKEVVDLDMASASYLVQEAFDRTPHLPDWPDTDWYRQLAAIWLVIGAIMAFSYTQTFKVWWEWFFLFPVAVLILVPWVFFWNRARSRYPAGRPWRGRRALWTRL